MRGAGHVPDPALLVDVRRMISSEFPSVGELDAEECASEAYCVLLEIARTGAEIGNPAATIRQIARRDLLDERKDRSEVHRATPLAPGSIEFHAVEDLGSELLSELEEASTGARLSAIVATLTKRQRAVFKCRFALGMSAAETAATCGLGRSTVKREWKRALKAASEALAGFEGELFGRAQLRAVHAYVFRFGELATDDPRRRLVEDDPATYQLMCEMRASMRSQAGVIDLNVALAGLGLLGGGLSLAASAALIRGKLAGAGASQGAGAGSAAGAGGGGGLVAAGAGGKLAAGCAVILCAGAGTAAIKATSEREEPSADRDRGAAESSSYGPPAPLPANLSSPIDPRPEPVTSSASGGGDGEGGEPGDLGGGGRPGHPDEASTDTAPVTDTAITGEEFDPLAAPPAPGSAGPVSPAPSSPGGSGASDGSSSGGSGAPSIAGNEWGP